MQSKVIYYPIVSDDDDNLCDGLVFMYNENIQQFCEEIGLKYDKIEQIMDIDMSRVIDSRINIIEVFQKGSPTHIEIVYDDEVNGAKLKHTAIMRNIINNLNTQSPYKTKICIEEKHFENGSYMGYYYIKNTIDGSFEDINRYTYSFKIRIGMPIIGLGWTSKDFDKTETIKIIQICADDKQEYEANDVFKEEDKKQLPYIPDSIMVKLNDFINKHIDELIKIGNFNLNPRYTHQYGPDGYYELYDNSYGCEFALDSYCEKTYFSIIVKFNRRFKNTPIFMKMVENMKKINTLWETEFMPEAKVIIM